MLIILVDFSDTFVKWSNLNYSFIVDSFDTSYLKARTLCPFQPGSPSVQTKSLLCTLKFLVLFLYPYFIACGTAIVHISLPDPMVQTFFCKSSFQQTRSITSRTNKPRTRSPQIFGHVP